MMKKTKDLEGAALDWTVAKTEGALAPLGNAHLVGKQLFLGVGGDLGEPGVWVLYSPSTDWAQGGPIIERESIAVQRAGSGFVAFYNSTATEERETIRVGPTMLIAAMRCYCCAELGDEVDLPEGLS